MKIKDCSIIWFDSVQPYNTFINEGLVDKLNEFKDSTKNTLRFKVDFGSKSLDVLIIKQTLECVSNYSGSRFSTLQVRDVDSLQFSRLTVSYRKILFKKNLKPIKKDLFNQCYFTITVNKKQSPVYMFNSENSKPFISKIESKIYKFWLSTTRNLSN